MPPAGSAAALSFSLACSSASARARSAADWLACSAVRKASISRRSPMEASAGYSFAWTGVSGGMGETIGVDSFEIREKKTIRYEAEVAFDNKVVAPELGVFFASAVA